VLSIVGAKPVRLYRVVRKIPNRHETSLVNALFGAIHSLREAKNATWAPVQGPNVSKALAILLLSKQSSHNFPRFDVEAARPTAPAQPSRHERSAGFFSSHTNTS
jgi:hypothetical protein